MRKILNIIVSSIIEANRAFLHWVHNNLRNFIKILNVLCPYVTAYFVLTDCSGIFDFSFSWFIPLLFWIVIWLLGTIANKTGKGITTPVPVQRFTEVSSDGEITVPVQRLEELLVYMCDLEDWLEREGLLK